MCEFIVDGGIEIISDLNNIVVDELSDKQLSTETTVIVHDTEFVIDFTGLEDIVEGALSTSTEGDDEANGLLTEKLEPKSPKKAHCASSIIIEDGQGSVCLQRLNHVRFANNSLNVNIQPMPSANHLYLPPRKRVCH